MKVKQLTLQDSSIRISTVRCLIEQPGRRAHDRPSPVNTRKEELTMKSSNLAKLVSLPLLAGLCVSSAEAAYPTAVEAQHETVYLPTCWPEEARRPWLECAAVPGRPVVRDLQDPH